MNNASEGSRVTPLPSNLALQFEEVEMSLSTTQSLDHKLMLNESENNQDLVQRCLTMWNEP